MIRKDKLVLFGPPGVGKSTVGRLLGDNYGYCYFNGDDYSLPEGIALNRAGKGLTPELRDREYKHIIDKFLQQAEKHDRIVMDYHMMFDRYRLDLRRLDKDLRWVYLVAPFQAMMDRFDRPGHLLSDLSFIENIFNLFEKPSFPVTQVDASLPIDKVVERVLNF